MKKLAFLFLLILLSQTAAFAQKKRPRAPRKNNLAAQNLVKEKEALEAAVAIEDKAERVNALRKFAADFPKSKELNRVSELLVSTLAALADEKMQAGETNDGIELFKQAVNDALPPVSDKLFTGVLSQIPNSLFLRGQTAAAIETAQIVEAKVEGNAVQTLALAGFYLRLENAAEAKRLAEKSLALAPDAPAAYQTLGLAERLNFNLENSVVAYKKALELAPDLIAVKRNLAEMQRAVGKPADAVTLYREILANNETDEAARTGLTLALFDEEKKSEAETEMGKAFEANPNNLLLLVGAAYWYAAHNDGAKAVEMAEHAVAVEPRYTWAHIALARGLIVQKRPLDAEKTLLTARQYGNFPTLEYELAAARMQSGFYREAAEGLAKSFTMKDGAIETNLGGRVSGEAKSFIELLSAERRASIFEPTAADNPENADKLKALLDFYQKVNADPNDETINARADEFIKGDDKMKMHRQLFAAGIMLNKKSNLPKVLELTKAAVGGVENGLNVANPAAAVLADELYDSRQLANARGEIILVPEVSKQTLSNVVRGRIEDLAGWALFQSGKPADAAIRLKRAVSILPAKSSWWRDSQWRLGTVLESDDKLKDALDAYIKSYVNGEPSLVKYSVVQSIYQRVNGNTDGLETKIGAKPASPTAEITVQTETPTEQTTEQTTEPTTAPETKIVEPKSDPEPKAETQKVNDSFSIVTQQFPPSPTVVTKPPTEVAPTETTPTKTETVSAETTPAKIESTPTLEMKIEESRPEEIKTETPKVETPKTEEPKIEEPQPTEIKKEEPAALPMETTPSETKPAEPAPVETKVESTKTEETKTEPAEPKSEPAETKPEPTEIKPEPKTDEPKETPATSNPETAQKSIFETIIITVPKAEIKPVKKPSENGGESRPRVVVAAVEPEPIAPCKILVNQETASIIGDGGILALIAELVGEGVVTDIKAVSSSPADVETAFDSEIGGQTKRALFTVKSISQKRGVFTVIFEMPCGKKEVSVSVR